MTSFVRSSNEPATRNTFITRTVFSYCTHTEPFPNHSSASWRWDSREGHESCDSLFLPPAHHMHTDTDSSNDKHWQQNTSGNMGAVRLTSKIRKRIRATQTSKEST